MQKRQENSDGFGLPTGVIENESKGGIKYGNIKGITL